MRRKEFERLAFAVQMVIENEMRGYGKGMASEGYAGGYLDALHDVTAILRGTSPYDKWGFWRKAKPRQSLTKEGGE